MCFAAENDSVKELRAELWLSGIFLLIIITDTDTFNTLPVWQKAQNRIFSSAAIYFIKLEEKLGCCLLWPDFPLYRNLSLLAVGLCLLNGVATP